MTETLFIVANGARVGEILRHGDRLALRYDPAWVSAPSSFPLSVSLPLAIRAQRHDAIEAYLWGLLPDNELVLERWGRRFGVSARNPFRLLAHVGEDCAGAAQLVTAQRLQTITDPARSGVEWLSVDDLIDRLDHLRDDHAATRLDRDTGQFSLAGAQPKLALIRTAGRWGVPYGATPTTHIVKLPLEGLQSHALVEHLCLSLANGLGLAAARSTVERFGEHEVVVVERFDRLIGDREPAEVRRVHQEDVCQALAVPPWRKYQNDGGPTPGTIAALLRETSARAQVDVERFRDALLFNWLIAGTDAHAKNYSLIHAGAGQVRLAPLYDLTSVLTFAGYDERRFRLAMKLGRTYRLADVHRRDLERLAAELDLDAAKTLARCRDLADAIPDALEALDAAELHPILVESLNARARACSSRLD